MLVFMIIWESDISQFVNATYYRRTDMDTVIKKYSLCPGWQYNLNTGSLDGCFNWCKTVTSEFCAFSFGNCNNGLLNCHRHSGTCELSPAVGAGCSFTLYDINCMNSLTATSTPNPIIPYNSLGSLVEFPYS